MELRPAEMTEIAAMRESRRRGLSLGLVPGFYDRLVGEAVPHLIVESDAEGSESRTVGYALLLDRPHDGHTHVTVLEVYLEPEQHSRYEEVLDLLRDEEDAHLVSGSQRRLCLRRYPSGAGTAGRTDGARPARGRAPGRRPGAGR